MKIPLLRTTLAALSAACGLALNVPGPVRAELADLSPVPLANTPTDAVLPNLMYILDDSGSMAWDYMPDNVWKLVSGSNTTMNNCKTASGSTASIAVVQCADSSNSKWGEPPYYSGNFNQIYYNPDITYSAGVNSDGISMGNISPTAAPDDAFINPLNAKTGLPVTAPRDLTTTYPEVYYCNITKPTAAQLADKTVCQRNGIDNVSVGTNYFLYWSNNTAAAPVGVPLLNGSSPLGGYPVATGTLATTFNQQAVSNTGHPYYFTITPQEYCSDSTLINCDQALSNGAAPAGFPFPAPIRYCATAANAADTNVVSDLAGTAKPKCKEKFDEATYRYPRYGRFTRTDIVPGTATYPKSLTALRSDCAGCNLVHLRRRTAEFRQLVQLLPHAANHDENGHRARLRADRRPLPRRLHHHQSEQPGDHEQVPAARRPSTPRRKARGIRCCTGRPPTAARRCAKRWRASAAIMPA